MAPNRKERRRAARRSHSTRSSGPSNSQADIFFARDPLAELPFNEVRAALQKAGEQAAGDLPALQRKLILQLKRCEPEYFLANATQFSLVASMNANGVIERPKQHASKLEQYHLEFAQASYLTIPANDLEPLGASPIDIQALYDTLAELLEAYRISRYAKINSAQTEQEQRTIALQERIRLHTLLVRNWAYYKPALHILRTLYTPLDDHCKSLIGIEATKLINCFNYILRSIEERSVEFRNNLGSAISRPTKKEMIQEYCKCFDIALEQESQLIGMMRDESWSRERLIGFLISHGGLFAKDVFEFSLNELAAEIQCEHHDLKTALEHLSYSYGDLSDKTSLDHIYLGNRIWERPILRNHNQSYSCYFPQLFTAYAFSIFDIFFLYRRKQRI